MTSIADLIADRKDVDIKIGSKKFRVAYRPNRVTMAEDAMRDQIAEDGDALATAKNVCRLLVSWELTGQLDADEVVYPEGEEDGTPEIRTRVLVAEGETVPLEPEVLQYLPLPILVAVLQGVMQDAMPNPTRTARTNRAKRR